MRYPCSISVNQAGGARSSCVYVACSVLLLSLGVYWLLYSSGARALVWKVECVEVEG
jgi:hypothetical protein